MTPFENASDRSVVDLAGVAAERALEDGDYSRAEITSVHVGNALSEGLGTQAGLANALSSALGVEGVRSDRIENTSATGASAVHRGVEAVASGQSDVALVVGVEKMSVGETADVTDSIRQLVHPGSTNRANPPVVRRTGCERLSRPVRRTPRRAGCGRREEPPERGRQPGGAVPETDLRRRRSRVAGDRRSASTLRLLSDDRRAAALVLSRGGSSGDEYRQRDGDTRCRGPTGSAGDRERPARGRADVRRVDLERDDVDVACIHDAFTVLELLELEELGFYDAGTAWEATLDGKTRLDGELPVNPGGVESSWPSARSDGDLPTDRTSVAVAR